MDIEPIIQATDWHKKWMVTDFCLLDCSFLAEYYHAACVDRFGAGFHHQFFILADGGVTTYLSARENAHVGQTVAARLMVEPDGLDRIAAELLDKSDGLRRMVKEPIDRFLTGDGFDAFDRAYREYLPVYVGLIRSGDWLTGETRERAIPIFDRVRLHTEDVYIETDKFLQRLAQRIAAREQCGLDLKNVLNRTDILAYVATGSLPSTAVLADRSAHCALYAKNGACEFVHAEDVKKFVERIAESFGRTSGVAHGVCAFPGRAVGRARIIMNPSDVRDFHDGDILVTSMTRPEFVTLMGFAGAIVTDAGGLLCHAAIVSREMKKPCVVGTQTATVAFKNGDLVEVDATSGSVKKIS